MQSAVEQCELKTILTSKTFLQKVNVEQRPEMVFVEDLVQFGRTEKIRTFLKVKLLPARLLGRRNVNGDDVAAVLFSSGSTGTPKGVMLSHRNLIANTDSVHQLFPMKETDAIASVLPLFHAFGFTYSLWFPLLHGAAAAYHPQPLDAKGLGELVLKTKATILPAPPTFCMAYLRGCSKEQFASLRFVLVGAERLNPKLAASFEEKFGIPMLEGYGATEMSPVIAVNVPNRQHAGLKQTGLRPGSVGQTIPSVAYRVVDRETGAKCQTGEEGLLLVKGPNRMIGYLNRPEETAAAFRDGWYVTGDIVTIDDEGFIKIVDRQSRFSKIAGEMVPHGVIEETLNGVVPGSRSVVTAMPDERRGERLIAFVSETAMDPAEIWSRLMNSELPKLWIPKREDIRVIRNLPLLGTGKVDLSAIKRLAAEATLPAATVA